MQTTKPLVRGAHRTWLRVHEGHLQAWCPRPAAAATATIVACARFPRAGFTELPLLQNLSALRCPHSRWYARPAQSPPMSRAAPLTTATHWSADNPTHLGGYQADANVRSGRANASPARGPTPDPRTPARPALALRAPPDLLLQVTAPWRLPPPTTCLQPSAPDRCPPPWF